MPPNPERQARLAARREQMANDPALRNAMDTANAAVLGKYERPAAVPIQPAAPTPRPMLPNYYAEGGKIAKPISPNFSTTEFGVGTMHTRKGRGLIDDDLPSDLSSAKPGPYGAHARGGVIRTPSFAKGGPVGNAKSYAKRK